MEVVNGVDNVADSVKIAKEINIIKEMKIANMCEKERWLMTFVLIIYY